MNNEIRYPCKVCKHLEEHHGIFEETAGGWVWLDDLNEEVWQEEVYSRPVCYLCDKDCIFEAMNNLDYLEWKHDIRNSNQ